jgi:hypothetical protein
LLLLLLLTGTLHAQPARVIVLKRAGVTAYEEVAEEFGERCRVRAHVVSFGDEGADAARSAIGRDDLVVTVGQEALDAVRELRARVTVIPTLAFAAPAKLVGPPSTPPPELVLRVLTTARASVRTVATVFGPRSQAAAMATDQAARRLGIALVGRRVGDGPEAVRALRSLVDPRPGVARVPVDAIWLPGDTDVVTPQVFQYALRLQLERGLPLVAATRQQVHSGALLAADFSPRSAGRAAADLANRYLEGDKVDTADELDLYGGARVTVNALVARRLGVDRGALERLGARVE